jgi:hypothetical protein
VIILTEYKVQHFVPQWYQRDFSSSDISAQPNKHIWVYDVESRQIDQKTIYETAQEDDFYGSVFEKSLQEIETATASAINVIIKNQTIKDLSGKTRTNLMQFIMLQSTRTKSAKVITENSVQADLERNIKPKYRKKYEKSPEMVSFIDTLDLSDFDFFKCNMKIALSGTIAISDLTVYLLINKTGIPFITSDHPVVTNNYFYKKMREQGFQTPGLQFIVPITEKLCILLIHAGLYSIDSDKRLIIEVNKTTDVDSLNKLQILNCYKQILSNENCLDYLNRLHDETDALKRQFGFDKNSEENNYGFRFSFLRVHPDANKKIPQYAVMAIRAKSSKKSRTANPFRDESLLDEAWVQTEKTITDFLEEYKSTHKSEIATNTQ